MGVHWVAAESGDRFEPIILGISLFLLGKNHQHTTLYIFVTPTLGSNFIPTLKYVMFSFHAASATTFSRFIPSVKSRFDYGAVIFVLTFCLVSISSYRVDKLFELARMRLSTIAIGTSLCIIISMLFCPIWAGTQLQSLISRNLDKLADALDGELSLHLFIIELSN